VIVRDELDIIASYDRQYPQESASMHVLPDLLEQNLKVIFCGTAVGKQSAERRAYYAGNGNKFWTILCSVGITDRRLEPSEYKSLLTYRVGLTDLAKNVSGSDSNIKTSDFDHIRLRQVIKDYKPFALAFTSKKAGQSFFGDKRDYGQQLEKIGATRIYILPSTSGLANAYWSPEWWRTLGSDIRDL
jgi:double-stranded uracil-DNA glycosylase